MKSSVKASDVISAYGLLYRVQLVGATGQNTGTCAGKVFDEPVFITRKGNSPESEV